MNALATAIEKLVADPRVRIAGPALAALLVVGFLIMGSVSRTPTRTSSKPVSVLPERPLDIPVLGRSQSRTISGADAILAWQQPKPKPAASKAKPAAAKGVKATGTLTAQR